METEQSRMVGGVPEAPPREAALIVNAKSRRGRELFAVARKMLEDRGIQLVGAYQFRNARQLAAEVQGSAQREVPLIICGGGDGTFSAVARYFVGRRSVLGVLPLGTGNAFARDLGIHRVEDAIEALVSGRIQRVDLGVAGNDYFVNVATVGLTTLIARELTSGSKRRLGRAAYAVALVRALQKVKPFKATLTTPEESVSFRTLQVVIGNGRFHAGPFPIAPEATITEGRLNIYALTATSRSAFFRLALHMSGGKHVDLSEVHALSTTSGLLETEPLQQVTVDGELCQRTPLKFAVASRALPVVVPAEFGDPA